MPIRAKINLRLALGQENFGGLLKVNPKLEEVNEIGVYEAQLAADLFFPELRVVSLKRLDKKEKL